MAPASSGSKVAQARPTPVMELSLHSTRGRQGAGNENCAAGRSSMFRTSSRPTAGGGCGERRGRCRRAWSQP
eukprot:4436739-Lingulodinium_polyedra.AAC.1